MNRRLLVSLAFIFSFFFAKAQDTLPHFTVKDLGNDRIQISWINPFETIVQLNVQRSFDSLQGFKTIFSPQSPTLRQNGFVDTKVPTGTKMYYRIFYVLSGGSYFFTVSKKPPSGVMMPGVAEIDADQVITIRLKDAIIGQFNQQDYKKFRDSIIYQTKDTLFAISANEILVRPYAAKQMWRASQYIFTTREGFINIKLPEASAKHYRIVFFEEDGTQLFEINRVREPSLIVDKANFIHSGWFLFDLYENGVLLERNKFYVARDF
jgi:hypothetical protein